VSAPDDTTHAVFDEGDLRKYRHEIPNIVDDLGLSPHAYRLYGHMKRVCGASPSGRCYQGTRTLAKHCKMSVGKISEAKKELMAFKLIAVETFPASENKADQIRILDVWRANFERYAPRSEYEHPRSGGEHPRSGGEHPRSGGEQKKEPFKKEPFKKTANSEKRRKEGYEWLFDR
jgi:hypothetical protein